MILNFKDLIEVAKENDLLKSINKKTKRKKESRQENKKKYWKLTASERLHYDSVMERINESSSNFFDLTFLYAKVFFYLFAFLFILRYLLDVDRAVFLPVVLFVISIIPKVFIIIIIVDVILLFVSRCLNEPRDIKKLNKNYGFK